MNRDELADFLRRRREALRPDDAGLSAGTRRRARGLRREEVAGLAHISTDFYARLEQRRGSRPSEQTVSALARALRLSRDERDHLYELAGHTAPPGTLRSDRASPGLQRVLDRLEAPAQIVSDLGVTLSQNPLAEALVGVQTRHTGPRSSGVYRWFTDPDERFAHPEEDHLRHSRCLVSLLRASHGRTGDDPETRGLVDRLLRESDQFAALWERHEVAGRAGNPKRFVHPLVGILTLECQVLSAENLTETLLVFTASPGSEDEDRLARLSAASSMGSLSGSSAAPGTA